MAETTQEKSELPTGKKVSDARKKGQTAKSRDLTSVCVLAAGGLAVYLSRNLIFSNFRQILESVWSKEAFSEPGHFVSPGFFTNIIASIFIMLAPITLTIVATAVILNLIQTKGFIISFEALQISFANLNPLTGLRKKFSLRSLTELVKSLFKLAIVSYAVYSVVWPGRLAISELAGREVSEFLNLTGMLALKLLFRVAGIMLCLSVIDIFYQKWQTRKDLMMTRQEVKEEHKQSDGNPQIKSRIRSIQRKLIRQRMLSRISKASVIITNPTHFAVALQYESGMEAPTVVAKGVDFLALKIIATGRKHGVSIVRNPPLARALYKQVKLDETIPLELYRAVAKILAYIYQQKRRNQDG
ncbi:Flagellar biosynthetic protein FlhB [Syntrophobacter sp. SbD1]|nr:Flagellar biosynthetic protein FlhB [Syntrophobacter sp. SbD1]